MGNVILIHHIYDKIIYNFLVIYFILRLGRQIMKLHNLNLFMVVIYLYDRMYRFYNLIQFCIGI